MNKEFYIYVYLDPRIIGEYKYDKYIFNNEPFYIGKGSGLRFKDHVKKSRLENNKQNFLKNRKIKSILKDNLNPIIKIIFKSTNEKMVLLEEIKIIKLIGRKILNTGTLTNLTDGGDGCENRFITEEFRKKQSDIMKSYYKAHPPTKETNDKISKTLLSRKIIRSEETKNKIGVANKNRKFSDEYIKVLKKIRKGPKLTHRKHYKLISPDNIIFNFLGKIELTKFIHENNLSERKLFSNTNKGAIKLSDIRNVTNVGKINTKNCVGWQLIKK